MSEELELCWQQVIGRAGIVEYCEWSISIDTSIPYGEVTRVQMNEIYGRSHLLTADHNQHDRVRVLEVCVEFARGSRKRAANSTLSRPGVTMNGILEYALDFVAVTNKVMSLGTS